MDVEQVITEARVLITKAAEAHDSGDALRFSQAACNATNALRCALDSAAQTPPSGLSGDQIKHMVNRFLGWKLPENFHPDCGINFDADAAKKLNPRNGRYEPNGTNLLDYAQAMAMVRHMIEGLPPAA